MDFNDFYRFGAEPHIQPGLNLGISIGYALALTVLTTDYNDLCQRYFQGMNQTTCVDDFERNRVGNALVLGSFVVTGGIAIGLIYLIGDVALQKFNDLRINYLQ